MAGYAPMTIKEDAIISAVQTKWDRLYEHKQVGEEARPGILDDAGHPRPICASRSDGSLFAPSGIGSQYANLDILDGGASAQPPLDKPTGREVVRP